MCGELAAMHVLQIVLLGKRRGADVVDWFED
jgi:hypothetical protein